MEENRRMRTVAIIGAGPAGLTTAKYMLEAGLAPTVFEKRANVGGYWSPKEDSPKGLHVHPELRLNNSLSCNTFSDYYPYKDGECPGHVTAAVAWEYLSGYAKEFLPENTLRLSCSVTLIVPEGKGESCSWRVHSEDKDGHKRSEIFGFLVIATGPFSEPYIPLRESLQKYKGRVLHSSQYVGEDLFPDDHTLWGKFTQIWGKSVPKAPGDQNTKILVIGGYMSGVEMAAELALRVSSLPEKKRSQIEIIHAFSKPFWIVPRMLPLENPATPERPRVLPIDNFFYSVEGIVGGPVPMTEEDRNKSINDKLERVLGSDQEELGDEYRISYPYWKYQAPALGISESYYNFVKSGSIIPIRSRYRGITDDGSVCLSLAHTEGRNQNVEADIIVFATGYTPWPVLQKILAPELLKKMGIEPDTEDPNPDLLYSRLHKQVIYPELGRTIGFVGIHKRPYWGSLELTARWLSKMFSGEVDWPTEQEIVDCRKGYNELMAMGKTADAQSSQNGYLELIADVSQKLGIDPFKASASVSHSPKTFIPAHYPPSNPTVSNDDAFRAIKNMATSILETSLSPQNVSKTVFAQFQGKWKITKTYKEPGQGLVCGKVDGMAAFHPRLRTFTATKIEAQEWKANPVKKPCHSLGYDVPEYLYTETIHSVTEYHQQLKSIIDPKHIPKTQSEAKNKTGNKPYCDYIYHYDDSTSTITLWFVKADGDQVDGFSTYIDFGSLGQRCSGSLVKPKQEDGWGAFGSSRWVGPGGTESNCHWRFNFIFRKARLEKVKIIMEVEGKENYTVTTVYERP